MNITYDLQSSPQSSNYHSNFNFFKISNLLIFILQMWLIIHKQLNFADMIKVDNLMVIDCILFSILQLFVKY